MSGYRSKSGRLWCLLGSLAWIVFAGCHSPFVETTIENREPTAIHMVEVDYPSASFGVGNLDSNSQFHYRFKIQGSGPVKIEFTDGHGQVHTVEGPTLNQGQEGRLTIAIDPNGKVNWQPSLTSNP